MTSVIKDKNLVVEAIKKENISISANGNTTFTMDVSKSGYIPIGIVGHANGMQTKFYAYSSKIDGNTLTIGLQSLNSSAFTVNYTVYVLYQRT